MPTTDGSLAFEGWRPKRDAFQVKRLRDAGAVILGKANLSEFANSGSYSESGYGMVWNAFKPSKTSLGSSGGSAVATALSLAGFGMGTQTGVSLYAPSTGASLVTLRGTDGISSGAGVMPLTWLQDFEGPIARTTSDIARILNVTTGTDPEDIAHASTPTPTPSARPTGRPRWTPTRCRASRSATCPARSTARRATGRTTARSTR